MEAKLQRIKELIETKERVDAELEEMLGGTVKKERKPLTCSTCGSSEHTARKCDQKLPPNVP